MHVIRAKKCLRQWGPSTKCVNLSMSCFAGTKAHASAATGREVRIVNKIMAYACLRIAAWCMGLWGKQMFFRKSNALYAIDLAYRHRSSVLACCADSMPSMFFQHELCSLPQISFVAVFPAHQSMQYIVMPSFWEISQFLGNATTFKLCSSIQLITFHSHSKTLAVELAPAGDAFVTPEHNGHVINVVNTLFDKCETANRQP